MQGEIRDSRALHMSDFTLDLYMRLNAPRCNHGFRQNIGRRSECKGFGGRTHRFHRRAKSRGMERIRPENSRCDPNEENSSRMVRHLTQKGYRAFALRGGFDAWSAAEYPLEEKIKAA